MHSILYDVIFAPITELLFSNYIVTGFGFLTVLLFLAVWKYWKFTRRYSEFPSYPMLSYFVYCAIFRKIPSHVSFTSFGFQKIISVLKEFQNEGICLMWLGKPNLFVFNEEVSKMFSNEPDAVNKSYKYNVLRDVFGNGLVTSNGETWRKQRKMLNPVFHVGVQKHKMPIFNDFAEMLVNRISELENETTVKIFEYLKLCSLNILCESIIGLKVNNKGNKGMIKKLLNVADDIGEMIVYRLGNPLLHYKFMLHFIPSGRKYLDKYKEADEMVTKNALDMKASVLSGISTTADSENENHLNSKSLSHILIEHHAKDQSFTIEDVKSHISTFIGAGYETVSCALMWCLFLLGLHPDVQEQVYDEVQSISEKNLTFEDLQKLKYMECVIKETLRLYPPVPIYSRCIDRDIQCGKYLVPKGTDIAFCPYMLHRDPKIYPNPETFEPGRFLKGNLENRPWTHIPFSEGLRNCIGKRFAMTEMMVILTHILRKFRVTSLDKREDLDLCWNSVITPSKPLNLQFSARK